MTEEEIIKIILDEAFHIHKTIGPGRADIIVERRIVVEIKY